MKRKGFTLIELLAVIVVLAIIALIATPIVMNVIKNAQKGSAERSAERYLDAVETAIATDRLENDLIADGTYTIVDGQLEGTTLDIEVSGDYPKSGTVTIENGQVVATGTSMTIGDYTVTIDNSGKAIASEKADEEKIINDPEDYGVTYYTLNGYGEDPATAFIYIDPDKTPEGLYVIEDRGYGERRYFSFTYEDEESLESFKENYESYLLEIAESVFNKYDISGFMFDPTYDATSGYGIAALANISINIYKSNDKIKIDYASCYC